MRVVDAHGYEVGLYLGRTLLGSGPEGGMEVFHDGRLWLLSPHSGRFTPLGERVTLYYSNAQCTGQPYIQFSEWSGLPYEATFMDYTSGAYLPGSDVYQQIGPPETLPIMGYVNSPNGCRTDLTSPPQKVIPVGKTTQIPNDLPAPLSLDLR